MKFIPVESWCSHLNFESSFVSIGGLYPKIFAKIEKEFAYFPNFFSQLVIFQPNGNLPANLFLFRSEQKNAFY